MSRSAARPSCAASARFPAMTTADAPTLGAKLPDHFCTTSPVGCGGVDELGENQATSCPVTWGTGKGRSNYPRCGAERHC